MTPSHPHNEQL